MWCTVAIAILLCSSPALAAGNTAPVAYVCSGADSGFTRNYGASIVDLETGSYTTFYQGQSPPSGTALSPDGRWLYVLHGSSCTLSRVDIASRSVDRTIQVDMGPTDIAVSPDGSRIYVSCSQPYYSNTICVIDASSFEITSRFHPGISPARLVLSPGGSSIYVLPDTASSYSWEDNPDLSTVLIMDPVNGNITGRLRTGQGPSGIAIGSNGTRAYVTCKESDNVTVIDLTTGARIASIHTMRLPVDIIASPDGKQVYVVNDYYGSSFLATIDTVTDNITRTIDLRAYPDVVPEYGPAPKRMQISGDGGTLYIASPDANVVSAVDLLKGKVTAIPVESEPRSLCMSGDSRTLYVACTGSASILTIDTASRAVADTVYRAMAPWDLTYSPDGTAVYIINGDSGTIAALNASTGITTNTIYTGGRPLHAAVTPSGDRAYVTDAVSECIYVIDMKAGKLSTKVSDDFAPTELAISPDGTTLYYLFSSGEQDDAEYSIAKMSTGTLQVEKTARVGKYGGHIDVSPDGGKVYVTLWESGRILSIDPETLTIVAELKGVGSTEDVRASPDGRYVYVANLGGSSLTILDADTLKVAGSIDLPVHPGRIDITPDGSTACVVGQEGVAIVNLYNRSVTKMLPISDVRGIAVNPAADMPLRVWKVTPANQSGVFRKDAIVSVTLSEPVNASTVNRSTYTLGYVFGQYPVTGNISISPDGRTLTFMPADPLMVSMTYGARLTDGVESLDGDRLPGDYTWWFGTSEYEAWYSPFLVYALAILIWMVLPAVAALLAGAAIMVAVRWFRGRKQ